MKICSAVGPRSLTSTPRLAGGQSERNSCNLSCIWGEGAEAVYETLPADVKGSFSAAVEALRKRLQPPKRDALRSAQLIRRKQQSNELVDKYAQDFELLFDKSYGQREGMDQASKGMLKRDLFVQGLMWKWQEKVLPSANSFDDALYQARIAEEQERQLSDLHRRDLVSSKHFALPEEEVPITTCRRQRI